MVDVWTASRHPHRPGPKQHSRQDHLCPADLSRADAISHQEAQLRVPMHMRMTQVLGGLLKGCCRVRVEIRHLQSLFCPCWSTFSVGSSHMLADPKQAGWHSCLLSELLRLGGAQKAVAHSRTPVTQHCCPRCAGRQLHGGHGAQDEQDVDDRERGRALRGPGQRHGHARAAVPHAHGDHDAELVRGRRRDVELPRQQHPAQPQQQGGSCATVTPKGMALSQLLTRPELIACMPTVGVRVIQDSL